jgi:hypothetical protein
VKVKTLQNYYAGDVLKNGLLLGYGGLAEVNLIKGMEVIIKAIRAFT